ncbi:MAG: uridine kinase family protein [Nocardioidaceae bacterium]
MSSDDSTNPSGPAQSVRSPAVPGQKSPLRSATEGYDVEPCLSRVVAAVDHAEATLDRAILLAVDGPAGSGKTSLAEALASRLTRSGRAVTMLHMDDLYEGWSGLDVTLEERVLDQVLRPLAAGVTGRWQAYDWEAGRFDEWHEVAPPDVLILEGCGSGAARYAPYTSLLVWLEADPATRIARGIARDGEEVRTDWLGWMELESSYFATNRTSQRADLTCRTD